MSVVSGFVETTYATGLVRPSKLTFAPDGRLFVSQQDGDIKLIKEGQLLSTPFLTLPVNNLGERGVLGVAFDPNFTSNHFLYVYWTVNGTTVHNRVSRFTADGDVATSNSELDLLELPDLNAENHNGGGLAFGPDGKLYVSVGENGEGANSQSLETTLGKILRINTDGSIPSDNPFFSQTTGINRSIWALGLRNPYSLAFNTAGDLFINDVGQNVWEEVDRGARGANYGWPETEGPTSDSRFTTPIYAYERQSSDNGLAIVGADFYEPAAGASAAFPSPYRGQYFFADHRAGFIRTLDPAHGNTVSPFASGLSLPVDLQFGPDGALYTANTGDGTITRYAPSVAASDAPAITTFPESQTVLAGKSVTFTVAATASGTLSYQWKRNDVNIPGATQSTYTINAARATDSGARITVVVSNSGGSSVTTPAVTLTVTTQPDLIGTIVGLKVDTTAVGNTRQKLKVRIKNVGTAVTNSSVTVNLRLSDDPVADDSDPLLGSSTRRLSLRPNKSSDRAFAFNYPATLDGNFYILAQLDTGNAVTETSETNNTVQSTTTVAVAHPFVDFSVQAVNGPAAVTSGKKATAIVTILNAGNISISSKVGIALYQSTDSTGAAGAVTLTTVTPRLSLKSNRQQKVKVPFIVPAGTAPGSYYLAGAVDPAGLIAEGEEANNFAAATNAFQLV